MKIQFIKNKTYILLAIFGLIILCLVLFLVVPLFLEINHTSEDLLSGKNEVAILVAESDQIESFKKVYDEYKPNLEKIDALFVDPQNPVDFIKFLEDMASNSSINLKISLIEGSGQKGQSIISFQLFSHDDFSNIMGFVQKLEQGPYLIEIQNVSLKNTDKDSLTKTPSGNVDANLLINAFTK